MFIVGMLTACGAPARSGDDADAGPEQADAGPSGCGVATYLRADAPGNDGQWGNADDHVIAKQVWTFVDGRVTRLDDYGGAGADGIWDTADDVLFAYTTYAMDAQHRLIQIYHDGPGPDGAWLTPDDGVNYAILLTDYDGVHYTGGTETDAPGADGIWGTDDDHVSAWYAITSSGTMSRELLYTLGLDMQAHTADDHIEARDDFGQRPDGSFGVAFYAAGIDGVFNTGDDVVRSTFVIDCGAGTMRQASAPGPDGQWFTSDDVTASLLHLVHGTPCLTLCETVIP